MKNKTLVCAFIFALFVQSLTACKTSVVSSQSGAANTVAANADANQNSNQPSPTPEKTAGKPETKTIKLTEKLKTENLTKSDYVKLSETLGWKNFCEADKAIEDNAEDLSVPFYKLGDNEYLLEISCNRAGAYLTQYLFYYINETTLTANLLSFERFEKNDVSVPLQRFVSFQPIGAADFDDQTKNLTLRHPYNSAESCGWEAVYTIKNSNTDLTEMRAEWNCQPGTDSEKWQKLNVESLRKKLPKPVSD